MASGKRRTRKKAAAAKPPAPVEKLDYSAASAFLRSRIRNEKDAVIKALLERELAPLAERAKKAAVEKAAFKTTDGVACTIGSHVWILDAGDSSRYYARGGYSRAAGAARPPSVTEYIVRGVRLESSAYGGGDSKKFATLAAAAGKSTKTIQVSGQYGKDECYGSRKAAVNAGIRTATKSVADAREELADSQKAVAEFEEALAAMRALLTQPTLPLEPPANGAVKKKLLPATSAGRASKPVPWTPEMDAELAERIREGASIDEISSITGRTRESVRKRAGRLHLRFAAPVNGKAPAPVEDAPPPKVDEEAAGRIAGAAADEAEPLEENAIFRNREFPSQRVRVRDSAGGQVLYVCLDFEGQPTTEVSLMGEDEFRADYEAIAEPVAS